MLSSGHKFLVDANLPKHFSFFNSEIFIHSRDIKKTLSDEEIWNLALKNNYVILTKDADFYFRCFVSVNRPKIVFFKIGNSTLKELHNYFSLHWATILSFLKNATLIEAKKDSIQIIL